MTGKWRRLLALGAGVVSTVTVVSAINAVAGPNGTGGGPTAERIQGSGSDTTQILMMHLDGLYMLSEGCAKYTTATVPLDFSCIAPDPASTIRTENYEHDQIQEADFLGSSTGIKQVCTAGQAGTAPINFARSSRGTKTTDCKGLHFVAYARDGISLEAFDNNAATSGIHGMNNGDPLCAGLGFCLTQFQIQGIYKNCTITNWNDGTASGANSTNLGGNAHVIQIYTPQAGSGTRAQFETFVGTTDSSLCIAAAGQPSTHWNVPENQNTGIAPADKNWFIFPFSFALYSTEVNTVGNTTPPGYFLSKIDGIAVNPTTIADGSFPYGRNVYNVFCASTAAGTCGDPAGTGHIATTATVNYVGEEGWICKPSVTENAGWSGAGTPAVSITGPHSVSPHYQLNWQTLIANKIKARGFGPFALGVIGGGDLNSDHCRLVTT